MSHGDDNITSLHSVLLFGLRGMAACAWHAHVLGKVNLKCLVLLDEVNTAAYDQPVPPKFR
ncbi:hypothetical protein [Methanosarcina horonobensis]|uniref:hypothetical protein n=1 Tax=Methanosarcina horonobensis TaxID=418008 RepID=UPI000B13115D|nr:hypothetical protein [Methanosarcina horonobensis]